LGHFSERQDFKLIFLDKIMKFADVHAHLEHERFRDDLDKVIERCEKKGVVVINSGVNKKTNRETLEFSKRFPNVVKASFGIYPIDALAKEMAGLRGSGFGRDIEELDVDEELGWIEKHKDDCVAIGEIGVDYNWDEIRNDEKAKEKQREVFKKLLKLAKKIEKPIVVHSRKAEEDAIEILEKEGFVNRDSVFASSSYPLQYRGKIVSSQNQSDNLVKSKSGQNKIPAVIMHCFSGKKSLIKRCIENGWYFSIPAIITRLQHFQTLVEIVPLSQLLTETDSPYLAPIAGERNEPVNVEITVGEIAKIKRLKKKDVEEKIIGNYKKLFE